jgi:DNA repair exonuclease SbcCD nuclease subunit
MVFPSTVALITDVHFGARGDSAVFLDYYEQFYSKVFFPELESRGIDTVLMLGDTFDRRKYTNHNTLYRAKRMYFDKLEAMGISVYMLAGNHDCAFKNTNDVNSPELLLSDYANITVIDKPETLQIKGIDVCMIPWICSDNYTSCLEVMNSTRATLCMGHFEIAGFAMHRGMESTEGISKDLFSKFDMVFSGHYHHRSDDGHIYYLGNPYELTWQDYNDPRGFHIFDLNSRKLTFIQNPITMFVRLTYTDKGVEPLNLDVLDLTNCIIKLVVQDKTDFYKFDKFTQKLYTKGCHEIKILEDLTEYDVGEIDEAVNLEDTISVLSTYIDSVATDTDKEVIKTYMRGLYTEALNYSDTI